MNVDILAIGVHPDDVELSCSGTLLRHIEMGHTVGLLDLTRGELGSRGSADIRDAEAADAQRLMGALVRKNLRMADGFFTHNEENTRKIITALRKYRPKIVLANAIDDRHPDHGRAAKLTADACFLSGLIRIETLDEQGNSQAPWRPEAVYHYIQDRSLKPDFVIDITAFAEKKLEIIQAYKTQFFNPNAGEGPVTPISSKSFLDSVQSKDRVFGRLINVDFAEGFTTHKALGINSLFDVI